MFNQFLKETAELVAKGESFVTATVVRASRLRQENPETKLSFTGKKLPGDGLAAGARSLL